MTATTTNGLPYMVDTDPMGDVADIMQLLAEAIDAKALAAAAAYVPTISTSGTAFALGNGSLVGRYIQQGKWVRGMFKLTYGSTTTVGTGNYNVQLPVPPNANWLDAPVGSVAFLDNSAGTAAGRFGATLFLNTAPTAARVALGGTGGGIWTVTAPFAPAVGDIVAGQFQYEAA